MSTGVYMAEKTIEFVNYLGQRVEFDPSELNEITAQYKQLLMGELDTSSIEKDNQSVLPLIEVLKQQETSEASKHSIPEEELEGLYNLGYQAYINKRYEDAASYFRLLHLSDFKKRKIPFFFGSFT